MMIWAIKLKCLDCEIVCLHFDIRLRHEGLRTNRLDGPTLGSDITVTVWKVFRIETNITCETPRPIIIYGRSHGSQSLLIQVRFFTILAAKSCA
jgi:hypothetical protein